MPTAETVAEPLILPAPLYTAKAFAVTVAKASTAAVANTTFPASPNDEYGACEYADKPNI
jgi:hypothetical protein